MPNILKKLFHKKLQSAIKSTEEIENSFKSTIESLPISKEDKKIFCNFYDIKDVLIEDIMVPRSEVVAVSDTSDFTKILETFAGKNFKQILVYQKNLDNIIGYIFLKDVIKFAKSPKSFNIKKILREVNFIAPSMKCFETLNHMKKTHETFFVIVDEFGGVFGIISIENIVSKIFGDIKDYSFDKLSYIEKTPEGTYIVDARMPLYELQEKTGLQLLTKTEEEEIDVDTIGGFVASLAGKVPSVGEKISHNSTNVLFKVLDVSPRKINKLEIIIPN